MGDPIKKFESEARVAALKPAETLKRLGLSGSMSFCDIGAGTGLFTLPAVELTEGQILAVDVSEEMRQIISGKVESAGLSRVKILDDISKVPDDSADLAFMCTVMHELDDRPGMMAEISRVLKPGGKLGIIEFKKNGSQMGPPVHERISGEEMNEEAGAAGYFLAESFDMGENLYCHVYRKAVAYFAGGCFWGMEKLMSSIPGVITAESGYANGNVEAPTYERVCQGDTMYRETVRVTYDPTKGSLRTLAFAFFSVIDPTLTNRQGNDIGTQYQTGLYYEDVISGEVIRSAAEVIKKRYDKFNTEIKPLKNFYKAEEYHQKYLVKNPGGYCHLNKKDFDRVAAMAVDAGAYERPSDEEIRQRLTPLQYEVTQNQGTDPAFRNEYWDNFEDGIYVDIVTGEPLFSSKDKFQSSCGWPAFQKPIDENTVVKRIDRSYGMVRTEVSSRTGATHLGHVFDGDGESPNGVRYCIDSASVRFVPKAKMEEEGYGYLIGIFE